MKPTAPRILQDTLVKLLRRNAHNHIRKILSSAHAADIARVFRGITLSHQKTLFEIVKEPSKQAEVLSEMDEGILTEFLESIEDKILVHLVIELDPDDAADIINILPPDRAQTILKNMAEDSDEVEELLQYGSETAGGIMTTDTFSLPSTETASGAIEVLQTAGEDLEMAFYLYVVNEHNHLVGVVSLRQLVTVPADTSLADIMTTDVVRVALTTDQEDVARVVARYNFLAVPVVDEHNHLVGIVTVDDVIDVIRDEATEDILKIVGASAEEDIGSSSVVHSAKSRLPWLFASFLGGLMAAFLIGGYDETLRKVVPVAAFIPVIVGMAGNIGTQALTVTVRGLALGQIDVRTIGRTIVKEMTVGLICGLTYGFLLGFFAAFRYIDSPDVPSSFTLAISVGISICMAMLLASTVGVCVPLICHKLHIDPAVATGPFVTTSVDILGIFIYFNTAIILMGL